MTQQTHAAQHPELTPAANYYQQQQPQQVVEASLFRVLSFSLPISCCSLFSRDVDPSTLSSLVMFSFPFSSPRPKSQNLLLEDQVLMMRTETILSDPRNFHTLPRPNSCPNNLARINSLRSRETAKDNRECRLAA
jgi:hypothetical protein